MKKILFVTGMFVFYMFRIISKQHKIFRSIIRFNTVNVMNNLVRFKITFKFLFHNKAATFDIAKTITKRMICVSNKYISFMFRCATLPMRFIALFRFSNILTMCFSKFFTIPITLFSFARFPKTFFRTINSIRIWIVKKFFFTNQTYFLNSIFFSRLSNKRFPVTLIRTKFSFIFMAIFNLKLFFTNKTNFLNHNTLQTIKAAFRSSTRKQLSFLTLLTADYKHKKTAFLLTNIIITFLFIMSSNIYAADQFDKTDPAGTESPSDLDTLITTNNNVLDRLLADYREGCDVVYASATTLTVGAGQICCDNAARSLRRWRENTSSTNVTFSDLDVGSEAAGTYYIWAVADTDVSTFTCTISASSSAPTNKTYYALLGSFTNDAGLDITASSVVDYAATAVGDGSITTAKLADLAVTNAKIAATTIDLTTKVTGLLPVANVTTVTTATASSIPKLDASGYITAFYETYDSGWFSVALNTSYTKTHGLGTTKILMQVWYSADSGGSSAELVYMNFNSGGGQSAGCWTNTLSTTTVKINSGQYDLTSRGYSGITWGGTATSVATTGYYRVIAIALE